MPKIVHSGALSGQMAISIARITSFCCELTELIWVVFNFSAVSLANVFIVALAASKRLAINKAESKSVGDS